jgi:hypothetical protein
MLVQFNSMVSHWIPVSYNSFKSPGFINSMLAHCAKLPSPGSSFISMGEVLEAMEKVFERLFKRWEV